MNIDRSIKNIIGTKKHGGKNDLDGDGVLNRKDCQPRNTMRQDEVKGRGSVDNFKVKKLVMIFEDVFRSLKMPVADTIEYVVLSQSQYNLNLNEYKRFINKIKSKGFNVPMYANKPPKFGVSFNY